MRQRNTLLKYQKHKVVKNDQVTKTYLKILYGFKIKRTMEVCIGLKLSWKYRSFLDQSRTPGTDLNFSEAIQRKNTILLTQF